ANASDGPFQWSLQPELGRAKDSLSNGQFARKARGSLASKRETRDLPAAKLSGRRWPRRAALFALSPEQAQFPRTSRCGGQCPLRYGPRKRSTARPTNTVGPS